MKRCLACILASLLILTGCGGKTKTPSPSPTASSPVPGGIEEIAVRLVSDMAAGEFGKAASDYSYTQEMKDVITDGQFLKDKIWDPLISVYGGFTEITGTVASEYQGYDIISVKTSFAKARLYINVVFKDGLIAGINLAPDPEGGTPAKAPESVTETEVTFGKSGWELPGTITRPAGNGPFPAVILVHGSGPNDRDETVGANKPFRDIALGLARQGIATLRYDKRTLVHKEKFADLAGFTIYDETVEDAVLAYEFLKGYNGIDKDNIYILGHSLGGMMIPRIAKLTPGAAGYIIMAGAVTPLEDMIIKQTSYLNELDGTVTDQENQLLELYKTMRDNVKALAPGSDTPPEKLFGTPASYWLDLKYYDPAEEAKSIDKPLLILQGERDYQVTMEEFELWKAALANKGNAVLKSYDGLNHLMIYGTGTPGPQEYNAPGKVDDRVIEDIASWILERRP